jgi:hypothetical protein
MGIGHTYQATPTPGALKAELGKVIYPAATFSKEPDPTVQRQRSRKAKIDDS